MDNVDKATRRATMQAVRSKDTSLEMRVRHLLHRAGYRYRLHRSDLPGKPDLVFPGRRKVILLHGCFWHGHDCRPKIRPASNIEYWTPKIEGNKARDVRNIAELRKAGWKLLVLWECQLKRDSSIMKVITRFLSEET
jgi:DNA mismatch endonuclease, patch repair protein